MEQIDQIPLSSVILSRKSAHFRQPHNRVTHKIITASQNYYRSSSWIQMTTEFGKRSQLLEAEVIRLSINNSFRGHMGLHVTSFPIPRSGIIGFLCRKSRLYFHVSCLGYQWLPIHIHLRIFPLFFGYTSVRTPSLFRGVGDMSSGSQILSKKWGCTKKPPMPPTPNPHRSLE